MKLLEERIREDGVVKEGNVLKVDSFLNHQMDIELFNEMGKEWARLFADRPVTKILTVEASGIGIACVAAQLRQALGNSRYESVDDKVSSLNVGDLQARVYTDAANFSYRLDGNNVDIDTENVELASNQIKYNGLINSINQEFANLKMVMK